MVSFIYLKKGFISFIYLLKKEFVLCIHLKKETLYVLDRCCKI
jgi:hypothetical protein